MRTLQQHISFQALNSVIDLQTKKAVRTPKKLLKIINNNFSEKGNR